VPFTNGFRTTKSKKKHFKDHGADFNATSEEHYEQLADDFMGRLICPKSAPKTCSCVRLKDGDTLRFDISTMEYAVLSFDGYIRTYFIPDPSIHGSSTNYTYFFENAQLT